MSFDVEAWLKQPTTIHGIGALAAAAAGFGVFFATGNVEGAIGATTFVYGAVHMILPDNSKSGSSVEHFVEDAVKAVAEKRVAAMLPALVADAHAAFLSNVSAAAVTTAGAAVSPAAGLSTATEAALRMAQMAGPAVGDVEAAVVAVHPASS